MTKQELIDVVNLAVLKSAKNVLSDLVASDLESHDIIIDAGNVMVELDNRRVNKIELESLLRIERKQHELR